MASEFHPDQFTLVTDFDEFRLDKEAAANVANAVFARNNPGKYKNNACASSETPFVIDATHEGFSLRPGETIIDDAGETKGSPGFRVHIAEADFAAGTDRSNAAFAFRFQRLLDAEERENRMGTVGTTLFSGGLFGLIAGPALTEVAMGVPKADEWLFVVSAVYLANLGRMVPFTIQHIGRRMITNPEGRIINRQHMIKTLKYVGQLGIEPLLKPAEPQLTLFESNRFV